MIDFWLNGIEHLIDRITGPLHFRILLQPLMALIYGVIDGLKDAGAGKPPYFWACSLIRHIARKSSGTAGRASARYSCWRWFWMRAIKLQCCALCIPARRSSRLLRSRFCPICLCGGR